MEILLNNKFVHSFYLLALLLLFVSCSDDPNSVGNALVPEKDRLKGIKVDSFTESYQQTFKSFQNESSFLGSSGRILLGSYKNISSEVLLSFFISLPDSIELALEAGDVILKSSWIEMYPSYWIGDSSNYNFSVHQINTHWTSVQLDEDTLSNIHSSLGANIIESYAYTPGDTVIKFSLPNDIVDGWAKKTYDESYPENNGILLQPASSNGIAGFQALTSFPFYKYPTLFMEYEKAGEYIDTVKADPKLDIHIPTGERLPEPTNSILLQGAINVRGNLKIDIQGIPKDVLINSAVLDLFFDETNSFEGSIKTDTVAVSFYFDNEADSVQFNYGKYPIVKKEGKFSGDIRQFVQRWVDGEPNEGLEVKLSDEERNVAAISLYSSTHPDKSLRPRITINYTTR